MANGRPGDGRPFASGRRRLARQLRERRAVRDKKLARVLTGIEARGHRGRSDLYRWLRARYRALAKALDQHNPAWHVLAEEVAAAGVVGRDGKPPTANAVRKVWARVARDVQAVEAERAKKQPPRHAIPASQRHQPPPVVPSPYRPLPPVHSRPQEAPTRTGPLDPDDYTALMRAEIRKRSR